MLLVTFICVLCTLRAQISRSICNFRFYSVIVFGPYSRDFSNLGVTAVTLFSVLNGDIVQQTFKELYTHNPFLSRFYLCRYL